MIAHPQIQLIFLNIHPSQHWYFRMEEYTAIDMDRIHESTRIREFQVGSDGTFWVKEFKEQV